MENRLTGGIRWLGLYGVRVRFIEPSMNSIYHTPIVLAFFAKASWLLRVCVCVCVCVC